MPTIVLLANEPLNALAVGVAAGGLIVAAWLLRARLPRGLPEGLLVSAVTGAVCVLAASGRSAGAAVTNVGSALVALCAAWTLCVATSSARASGSVGNSLLLTRYSLLDSLVRGSQAATRRVVVSHAALMCGVAAAGHALAALAAGPPASRGAAVWDLAALLVLALVQAQLAGPRRAPQSESSSTMLYLGAAGLALALLSATGAASLIAPQPAAVRNAAIAAAAVLLVMLMDGLARWRNRTQLWLNEPQRLADPVRRPTILFALVVAVTAAVGVVFFLDPAAPVAPIALFIASLACFIVLHRGLPQTGAGSLDRDSVSVSLDRDSVSVPPRPHADRAPEPLSRTIASNVAMILAAGAVATIATAWFPATSHAAGGRAGQAVGVAGPPSLDRDSVSVPLVQPALVGVAVAGLFMLWLARFWQQQLLGDKPWTTAGSLVPVARRAAHVATAAGAALAAAWLFRLAREGAAQEVFAGDQPPIGTAVRLLLCGALIGLLAWCVLRDAVHVGNLAGVHCAWPGLAAGGLLVGAGLNAGTDLSAAWVPTIGLAGGVALASMQHLPGDHPSRVIGGCWTGGLPVPVLILAIWGSDGVARTLEFAGAGAVGLLLLIVGRLFSRSVARRPARAG